MPQNYQKMPISKLIFYRCYGNREEHDQASEYLFDRLTRRYQLHPSKVTELVQSEERKMIPNRNHLEDFLFEPSKPAEEIMPFFYEHVDPIPRFVSYKKNFNYFTFSEIQLLAIVFNAMSNIYKNRSKKISKDIRCEKRECTQTLNAALAFTVKQEQIADREEKIEWLESDYELNQKLQQYYTYLKKALNHKLESMIDISTKRQLFYFMKMIIVESTLLSPSFAPMGQAMKEGYGSEADFAEKDYQLIQKSGVTYFTR